MIRANNPVAIRLLCSLRHRPVRQTQTTRPPLISTSPLPHLYLTSTSPLPHLCLTSASPLPHLCLISASSLPHLYPCSRPMPAPTSSHPSCMMRSFLASQTHMQPWQRRPPPGRRHQSHGWHENVTGVTDCHGGKNDHRYNLPRGHRVNWDNLRGGPNGPGSAARSISKQINHVR